MLLRRSTSFISFSCKYDFIFCIYVCTVIPDVGAKNHRRLCAVYYNKTPGFEVRT